MINNKLNNYINGSLKASSMPPEWHYLPYLVDNLKLPPPNSAPQASRVNSVVRGLVAFLSSREKRHDCLHQMAVNEL